MPLPAKPTTQKPNCTTRLIEIIISPFTHQQRSCRNPPGRSAPRPTPKQTHFIRSCNPKPVCLSSSYKMVVAARPVSARHHHGRMPTGIPLLRVFGKPDRKQFAAAAAGSTSFRGIDCTAWLDQMMPPEAESVIFVYRVNCLNSKFPAGFCVLFVTTWTHSCGKTAFVIAEGLQDSPGGGSLQPALGANEIGRAGARKASWD